MNTFTRWILTRLLGGIGPILAEIEAVLIDPNTLANLIVLAQPIVSALEGRSDVTPKQKHDLAVADIEGKLKTLGIDVTTVLVNLAIEVALAYVRSQAPLAGRRRG